jgi:FkbM family methyltransferase
MNHCDIFQIGAHIGNSHNDPIFHTDLQDKSLVLIEPIPFLFDILKHNYSIKPTSKINFLNVGVSDYDGEIEMFAPARDNDFANNPFFLNQMASVTDRYLKYWEFDKRFPDFKFEKVKVECKRFNTIIKDLNISSIDHLYIDTEGHDHTILQDIDFSVLKPKTITFENAYIDGVLGKGVKYYDLIQYLKSHGYNIVNEDENDTTVTL